MKLSKKQLLQNIRNSNDYLAILLLENCETLNDVKNTIAHDLNFWLSIDKQLKRGEHFQWHHGIKYCKKQSTVDFRIMAYYRIANALNYTIELSDTFVYFK